MDPITWAVLAGLNVALAASRASQQEKQRKMEAEIRAAEIEASPWTGKAATTQMTTPSTNVWGELAGAGVNTLGQGAALQKAGLFSAQDVSGQVPSTSATNLDPNLMVGGQQTVFGDVGGQGLDEAARERIQYFNAPNYGPYWTQMLPGAPTLTGRR